MIRCTTFSGKTVAVFGLGASGNATARSLLDGGATVAAWDDSAGGREGAARLGIPIVDLTAADWSAFSALVLAPGVPLTHPAPHWTVEKARAAGVEIIGDVELFFRERAAHCPHAPVIAITGTNGKSTTTALVAHLLQALGHKVEMGGNIGKAVLTLAPPAMDTIHVLELSSFQIDLTPSLAPTVGVLLNITPDHIDRHGTLENYAAVKERLIAGADAACIGVDDDLTRAVAEKRIESGRPVFPFTCGKGAAVIPRLYAIGTTLFVHETGGAYASSTEIATLDGIGTLRGRHNTQNALASLVALRALQDRLDALGSDLKVWIPDALRAALASYPGLPHRMEEVGRAGRVLFINDSKATNADSTEKALLSFPRDVFWILGGRPKEGGIEALRPYFDGIVRAYLIGEASEAFARTLDGDVGVVPCGTLEVAVARAAADAASYARGDAMLLYNVEGSMGVGTRVPGISPHPRSHSAATAIEPVVLLSPACASYDQFKNFEVRGDRFRALVHALSASRRIPDRP